MANQRPPRKVNRRLRSTLDARQSARRAHAHVDQPAETARARSSVGSPMFFSLPRSARRVFRPSGGARQVLLQECRIHLAAHLLRARRNPHPGRGPGGDRSCAKAVNIFSVDLAKSGGRAPRRFRRSRTCASTESSRIRSTSASRRGVRSRGSRRRRKRRSLRVGEVAPGRRQWFPPAPAHESCPSISISPPSTASKSDNVRNGEPLPGEDLRLAVQLIETLSRHPDSLLHIRTIDVSRGYCLEVVNDAQCAHSFRHLGFRRATCPFAATPHPLRRVRPRSRKRQLDGQTQHAGDLCCFGNAATGRSRCGCCRLRPAATSAGA